MRLDQIPCALLANEGISCCEGIAQGAAVAGLMAVGRNHLSKATMHPCRGQRVLRGLAPAGDGPWPPLGPPPPPAAAAQPSPGLLPPPPRLRVGLPEGK